MINECLSQQSRYQLQALKAAPCQTRATTRPDQPIGSVSTFQTLQRWRSGYEILELNLSLLESASRFSLSSK